jgi:hypothetical protein
MFITLDYVICMWIATTKEELLVLGVRHVVTCHHSTSVVRSLKLLPLPQIYRTIISLSTNVTVSTRVVLVSYPVLPTVINSVIVENVAVQVRF